MLTGKTKSDIRDRSIEAHRREVVEELRDIWQFEIRSYASFGDLRAVRQRRVALELLDEVYLEDDFIPAWQSPKRWH